jgi:hypothetical protein
VLGAWTVQKTVSESGQVESDIHGSAGSRYRARAAFQEYLVTRVGSCVKLGCNRGARRSQ